MIPAVVEAEAKALFLSSCRATPIPGPDEDAAFMESGTSLDIRFANVEVPCRSWGAGPSIMLVHGIFGRGAQLKAFVAPLRERGYRVICADMPGFGRSTYPLAHNDFATAALHLIAEKVGGFHAVIAHSFGSVWIGQAYRSGMTLQKLALLAPLGRYERLATGMLAHLKTPDEVAAAFLQLVSRFEGESLYQRFSPVRTLSGCPAKGLVIQAEKDVLIPASDAQELVAAWTEANLVIAPGCDHVSLISSPRVVADVVDWVTRD